MIKKHPDVQFSMYADDGIMFADNFESIERVVHDPILPVAGIYFSDKLKKDGSPACGFIDSETIEFLGSSLDIRSGVLTSDKGQCHISNDSDVIMKFV
jgi:hypothetical protein